MNLLAGPAVIGLGGPPPNVIVAGPDPQTGGDQVTVTSPQSRSRCHVALDGTLTFYVEGKGVGKGGEGRLFKTLRQKLQQDGQEPEILPGRDDRGEDALLRLGDRVLVVQAATAPSDRVFWHTASCGGVHRRIDVPRAAAWLHDVLKVKSMIPSDQLLSMLLAVDAFHAAPLATRHVLDEYLGRFGDPTVEFSFSAVWIVGPTVPFCVRLGVGVP